MSSGCYVIFGRIILHETAQFDLAALDEIDAMYTTQAVTQYNL